MPISIIRAVHLNSPRLGLFAVTAVVVSLLLSNNVGYRGKHVFNAFPENSLSIKADRRSFL